MSPKPSGEVLYSTCSLSAERIARQSKRLIPYKHVLKALLRRSVLDVDTVQVQIYYPLLGLLRQNGQHRTEQEHVAGETGEGHAALQKLTAPRAHVSVIMRWEPWWPAQPGGLRRDSRPEGGGGETTSQQREDVVMDRIGLVHHSVKVPT